MLSPPLDSELPGSGKTHLISSVILSSLPSRELLFAVRVTQYLNTYLVPDTMLKYS